MENLAEKAGDKLTDVTGKLSDVAETGGSLPAIGSRVLQGESPMKAFVSEKVKGVKDSVVGKAKEAFGEGKGKRKSSGGKVMNIIEVLDVGVPLRDAYDFWTQYDQFSSFAKGVRDVSKSDEMESDWKVKVGPSSRSFKATVQEQIPDDRIVWTSEGAKGTTRGVVSFHELAPTLTRIVLVVEYYPSGFFEKTGNLWRAQGRRMRLDFKNFQRYVTLTDEEPEGWRGEIRDGEVVLSHEDAMEEEEADQEESEGEEPEGKAAATPGKAPTPHTRTKPKTKTKTCTRTRARARRRKRKPKAHTRTRPRRRTKTEWRTKRTRTSPLPGSDERRGGAVPDVDFQQRSYPVSGPQTTNLADILERVLDKGIVIAGDIKIDLLDIELLTIRLRLFVASVDTAKKAGIDWWEADPALSSRAFRSALQDENRELRERLEALESNTKDELPER